MSQGNTTKCAGSMFIVPLGTGAITEPLSHTRVHPLETPFFSCSSTYTTPQQILYMVTSSFSAGPTLFENISWHTVKFVLKYQHCLFRSFPSILEMKLYRHVFPVLQLTPQITVKQCLQTGMSACSYKSVSIYDMTRFSIKRKHTVQKINKKRMPPHGLRSSDRHSITVI